MKSGANNLWGDEEEEEENNQDKEEAATEAEVSAEDELEASADEPASEPTDSDASEQKTPEIEGPTSATPSQNIPYIARRRANGESTQWNRSRITFFVREHVDEGERQLIANVQEQLDEDVSKFDLREAAYIYAQRNPEGVAEVLEEMGVGFEL
jgi:hypothetical protein